jgi:hypothetical protein
MTTLRWSEDMKIAVVTAIAALLFSFAASRAEARCNPNEDCLKCQAVNPFNNQCILKTDAPDCLVRREACKGCIALTATKVGTSIQCVACVVGALASGGAVGPACAAPCGQAAVAERVAKEGGC